MYKWGSSILARPMHHRPQNHRRDIGRMIGGWVSRRKVYAYSSKILLHEYHVLDLHGHALLALSSQVLCIHEHNLPLEHFAYICSILPLRGLRSFHLPSSRLKSTRGPGWLPPRLTQGHFIYNPTHGSSGESALRCCTCASDNPHCLISADGDDRALTPI